MNTKKDQPCLSLQIFDGSFPTPGAEPEKESFAAMLHGKATDVFAELDYRNATIDAIAGKTTFQKGDVTVCISNGHGKKCTLGTGTSKLLCAAQLAFTKRANAGMVLPDAVASYEVRFSLKEYAVMCGWPITPILRPGMLPEEVAAEKKRANESLKNFRKKVNKDLQTLFECTVSAKPSRKQKKLSEADYRDFRLIDDKGIENGYIVVSFTPKFAYYLTRQPITSFALSLFKIDGRDVNAYKVGYALCVHHSMDSNIKKGTESIMRVRSILGHLSLPSVRDLRKTDHGHWYDRIKDPVETALDNLKGTLLDSWYYCLPKGEPMPDDQAAALVDDYEKWEDALIHFTLKDAPDHAPRMEAKQQRIEQQRAAEDAKRKRSHHKKKTPQETT